jgi:TldD protein
MEKVLEVALERLKEVDYGEVRFVRIKRQSINLENGIISSIDEDVEEGIGIRAVYKGCVGFASTSSTFIDDIVKTAERAIEFAKASYRFSGKEYPFLSEVQHIGEYITQIEKDPFAVPLEEKIDLLVRTDEILSKNKFAVSRGAFLNFFKTEKYFLNTEGSRIKQTIYESGGGYEIWVLVDGNLQSRSYPAPHRGNHLQGGYEIVEEMDFVGNAERISEEAVMFAKAGRISEMETTLVVGTHQMALQIHESVGHPLELDRVIGYEASYAGTSFATIDQLGKLKYGSSLMNIVADAKTPRGLGTFGWDDEGVPAQRIELITGGILTGYLSSRDSAWAIGLKRAGGTARASSYNRMPMVRMTNINLLPDKGSLEDLISEVKDGIFVDYNKSWSIDQRRLNFQFSTEVAYRIRNGKIAEPLRNIVYFGITPEFWNSLVAVGGEEEWKLWGLLSCGKGEPGQTMHTGHGSSPAVFVKVKVGSV